MIPHTPDFFSTIQLPYSFNPDAQCPKFIKYLERVQPIEENRNVIKMLMGLSLIPDTSYNVFFVLFGDGGSGKSVFLHILENIVGRQNVCAVALHELADRFSVAPITEKLLNIVGDLPTEDMSAPITKVEGVLKRITSGETIGVEYKHRDRYEATPTARCVFATNTLPYFADKTSAFWDRIRIIPFCERIRGSSEENRNLKYEIVE